MCCVIPFSRVAGEGQIIIFLEQHGACAYQLWNEGQRTDSSSSSHLCWNGEENIDCSGCKNGSLSYPAEGSCQMHNQNVFFLKRKCASFREHLVRLKFPTLGHWSRTSLELLWIIKSFPVALSSALIHSLNHATCIYWALPISQAVR